jgi:hypothetical protein
VVKLLSNLILRRLILLGTPVVVAIDVVFLHPVLSGDLRQALFPIAEWWLALHVAQLVVFGLMGIAAYLLFDDLSGIAATVGRLAIAVFIVFYSAADAVAGIVTGILARGAVNLPTENQATLAWAIEKIFADPTKGLLFSVSSYAWSIGLLAAAIALYRAGAPRLPLIALAVAALPWIDFSRFDHSPPFDPIALALFVLAALWLELARRQKRLASARAEDSPERPPSFSQSE